jgi:hypothetical protein
MRTARCYHGQGACTIEKMKGWWRGVLVVAGCAPALVACAAASGPSPAPSLAPAPPSAPVTVAPTACNNGPYTVWLDFDGASLAHGAADDATTMPLQSLLAQSSVSFPAFDGSVAAPRVTRAEAVAAVVDRVRTRLAPYAVDVTTTRPTSAPYSVVLVGGTPANIGAAAGEGGLANEDCGNLYDRDVSYVFAGELDPARGGVVATANTVLHEVGHAFGLLHTVEHLDLMYSVASPSLTLPELFTLTYAAGDYSSYSAGVSTPVPRACAGSDPVDNAALMACNAGTRARVGDVTPPSLSWDVPAAGINTVRPPLGLAFSASDDTAVVRLELYQNLELVAVLTAPPYTATIDVTPGEPLFVTVEAIDAAANRTTLSRAFAVVSVGVDDSGAGGADLGRGGAVHSRGCSFGGVPGGGGLVELFVVTNVFLGLMRGRGLGRARRRGRGRPARVTT